MISTRLATPADHRHYARLFRELGVPEAPLDAERFAAEVLPRAIVAVDQGHVVGYATWRLYGATAHIPNVVTAPEARRRGVGQALMDGLREAVTAAGCDRWYLNVKRENAAAVRLYERSGMTVEQESINVRLPWARVADLPAPWETVTAFGPTADDDARIADALPLPIERVAAQRDRAGYVARALRDGDVVVGYATFAPSFPGAYPFCVARPDLARPLLEALRPHALPEHDFLYVTAEGDPLLATTLLDAGGAVLFELYRMGARLG